MIILTKPMTTSEPEHKIQRKLTTLSDFQKMTEIGHGAFGKVYRATYKANGKIFALKKISKREVKAHNMTEQLSNEVKISRSLHHPNIIKLYETFSEPEDIYLVLQFAQNGQLYARLMREGRFDEKTTKQMTRDILNAVEYLHTRTPPIIHRDIKPENILMDKNNKIKLADFGWSNFLNKPRKTFCGTFDYLAPEMIDKSGHDEKLDIWCVGVLVYELLTGKTPFVAAAPKNAEEKRMIQQSILNVNINFPNDFPLLAKQFVLGMIKRKPEERLTMKEIKNHEWLKDSDSPLQPFNVPHQEKLSEVQAIYSKEEGIVAQLNKRIQQLEAECNNLKVNEKTNPSQIKPNEEYNALLKEISRLKGIEQRCGQLTKDNQKMWEEIENKDREIILLKGQMQAEHELAQNSEKLKQDKRSLQEKLKKIEKELANALQANQELKQEMNESTVLSKIKRGQPITEQEASSKEFVQYLKNQIFQLQEKFDEASGILQKVIEKTNLTQAKEEELARLRAEQRGLREQLKAEVKDDFEEQKDRIILTARAELMQEREKWFKERDELKRLLEASEHESMQTNETRDTRADDLQLELKTLRELNIFREKALQDQKYRIKDLEDQLKRSGK